ncbi:MAG: S-methyl-5'-thioadenosine phosphorylase [Spirochaetia bacterium]
MKAQCAIIGGSGLEDFESGKTVGKVDIPTPFGMPSDIITLVDIGGIVTAFLPRHGLGHRILPNDVPSKANIWALKSLGVKTILAVSAVGSLHEEYKPGDFVICDGIIDRTHGRNKSYFGDGVVGHVGYADPFCPEVSAVLRKVMQGQKEPFHPNGTVLCMQGPPFSTRQESFLFKDWGAHIIGMTALPEAQLAREAEICYAGVGIVTDYDCWREKEEDVTVEMVIKMMQQKISALKSMIPTFTVEMNKIGDCACRHAAASALMTDQSLIPYETKRRLNLFYGKYWQK